MSFPSSSIQNPELIYQGFDSQNLDAVEDDSRFDWKAAIIAVCMMLAAACGLLISDVVPL